MYRKVLSRLFQSVKARCWWLTPVILPIQEAEDHGWKPVLPNSSKDPISKKTLHRKMAGGVAQGVDPELKSHTAKKKESNCNL
jgi:hypothetical protein